VKEFTRWLFRKPVILLVVGLVNGLIFVFLMPPWQHYDEPGHFEYVWQIANNTVWPQAGDYDPAMRRVMLLSMQEHGFYRGLNMTPDLTAVKPDIGLSQVGDPPVFYWLASLPLHFLHNSSITLQLYASRLVSLILFLVTIFISWAITLEVTLPNHALRWIVPITLAMLPGFIDLMTAVNNEVGAVAVFSLFLWVSIRLVRRGYSFLGLVFVLGAAILCYLTKNTVWIAFPMLPVIFLFTFLRGRWRHLAWGLFLGTAGFGLGFMLMLGDASQWYRRTLQTTPTRVVNSMAPLGNHAFQLDISLKKGIPSIQQPIPFESVRALKNSRVTLGAWIWSNLPMRVQLPVLACECGGRQQVFSQVIESGTEPKYYKFSFTVPGDANVIWVALIPPEDIGDTQGTIFYDGLVLIKSEMMSMDIPIFGNVSGTSGEWGGQSFSNILRNPSAEQAGIGLQSWVNETGRKFMPPFPTNFPSDILVSIFDWKGAGWYYRVTFGNLLRTFWAKFGWAHVPLLGSKPYQVLAFFTFFGLAGATCVVIWRRHSLPWELILVLALALFGIWIPAITRGIGSLFGNVLIPSARYAYSAIIPTILVLSTGWFGSLQLIGRWLRIPSKGQAAIYLGLFVLLDAFSVLSIFRYYYIN
jgi:hypothetical protein